MRKVNAQKGEDRKTKRGRSHQRGTKGEEEVRTIKTEEVQFVKEGGEQTGGLSKQKRMKKKKKISARHHITTTTAKEVERRP